MNKKDLVHIEYQTYKNISLENALKRTTHLAIATHPDDLEIMATHGILECYKNNKKWFTGIVVTDGAGSARKGPYKKLKDNEMIKLRSREQKKAARLGQYGLLIELKEKSAHLKNASLQNSITNTLAKILNLCRPQYLYLHNPFDKHLSHIACLKVALKATQKSKIMPKHIWGCEVWRDLDWLSDQDKVILDLTKHQKLALDLIRCFDSQIAGGKRYDLATLGRRRAHATFLESHNVDKIELASYAVDLTDIVKKRISLNQLIKKHLKNFQNEVLSLHKF